VVARIRRDDVEGDWGQILDPDALARFIHRHDPSRVLREVEADRKLLAEYEVWAVPPRQPFDTGMRRGLQMALEIRAEVWSGHPDYQDQWKP
jgi:hypothetical protein